MTIVYCEQLLEHTQWADHPESPLRLKTMKKKLEKEDLWHDVIEPEPITEDMLYGVHTKAHIEKLKKGGNYPIDPDTFLHDDTYGLAMLSASVAVTAVRSALKGHPTIGLTRPPGHHAGRDHMGGFCYINNVAVAVDNAKTRTAIVDIDVHHCNGTEEIFYSRDDVMVISIHEANFYWNSGYLENTGEGKGKNFNINIPIPAGSGNRSYLMAMDEIIVPVIRRYDPELIVVSLGVDGHYCDPNSHMLLNTQGYIELCRRLFDIAKDGKIAFILEGGYHLRATAEVVAGVVGMFSNKEIKPEYGEDKGDQSNGPREVRKDKEYIARAWDI
ncbi:MAG: histone deacetylase [Candidatus Methanomethylophilaceae archaeon]